MKPFEVRLCAMPSSYDGMFISTHLFSPRQLRETHTITHLDELEIRSAELAQRLGETCVVWIGPENERARKPRGFDAECERLAKIFRDGGTQLGELGGPSVRHGGAA